MAESYGFSRELNTKKNPTKLAVWTYFGYTEESTDIVEKPSLPAVLESSAVQASELPRREHLEFILSPLTQSPIWASSSQ